MNRVALAAVLVFVALLAAPVVWEAVADPTSPRTDASQPYSYLNDETTDASAGVAADEDGVRDAGDGTDTTDPGDRNGTAANGTATPEYYSDTWGERAIGPNATTVDGG